MSEPSCEPFILKFYVIERGMNEQRHCCVNSAADHACRLPDMRVVLLGNKASGKSSCVATVLGREFLSAHSAQCMISQGDAAGRATTLVEAPGWWSNYLVKDTPALNAQEVQRSVTLCFPGPHAVLLVVRLDTRFTETNRRAVEERVQLLSSSAAWSHCMVLFTCGDHLGDVSVEEHVRDEGAALRWLVEKCGRRFHVLNNVKKKDCRQVEELLEKVERMVVENGGCHFEVHQVQLHVMELRRRSNELKAVSRQKELETQRRAVPDQHQTELRVLVVGHRHSGKSSVGNAILGREEFDIRRMPKGVSKQREVAGRLVSVVEAPGWWNTYQLMDSPRLNKQELLGSVSLCPPGPHVVILTLRADGSFTSMNRRAIEEHLGLFGETVWNHTMVVFTYGDWLGETSIELYIESEGYSLQWLVEKCGNRYHVLGFGCQVTELLRKMDEMICANGGRHYEVDGALSQEVQRQQQTQEQGAKHRMSMVAEKREYLRSLLGFMPHISELRIVLLGWRYSGKSSSGNTILGSKHFCAETTTMCVRRQGRVGERQVVVVEAPGWLRSCPAKLTPESEKQEMMRSVCLCEPGPHAVLLVIQVDASFTERESSVKEQVELLGQSVWSHTMVLFTCGDWLGETSIEQHIECEGTALQELVDLCRNRYHVLNNQDMDGCAQVTELLDKVEEMVAGNAGCFSAERPTLLPVKAKRQHSKDDKEKAEKEKCLRIDDEHVRDDVLAFSDREMTLNLPELHVRKANSMQHPIPEMSGYVGSDDSSGYGSGVLFPGFSLSSVSAALPSTSSSLRSGVSSLQESGEQQRIRMKIQEIQEDDCNV